MVGLVRNSDFLNRAIKFFVSLAYVGHVPFAPGTAGTAVAAVVFWVFRDTALAGRISLIVIVFVAGVAASTRAEALYGTPDSGTIVIDEFVGFWITMLFLPATPFFVVSGFLVFRFFDIVKPYPIRMLEKRYRGGLGVMIDDVAAGVYANLTLQAVRMAV